MHRAILCYPGEEKESEEVPFEQSFEDKAGTLSVKSIKLVRSSPKKSRNPTNSKVASKT